MNTLFDQKFKQFNCFEGGQTLKKINTYMIQKRQCIVFIRHQISKKMCVLLINFKLIANFSK